MTENTTNITHADAPYSLTLKAGKDFDAPWLVVKAATVTDLHDKVNALVEGGVFATLGNAAKSMHAAYVLGKTLGAQPESPPLAPTPATTAPSAAAKPAADSPSPWGSAPAGPAWGDTAPTTPAATSTPAPVAAPQSGFPPTPAWGNK